MNAREACATYFAWKPDYNPGERFTGGATQREDGAVGAFRAIDPATAQLKWEFKLLRPSTAGWAGRS